MCIVFSIRKLKHRFRQLNGISDCMTPLRRLLNVVPSNTAIVAVRNQRYLNAICRRSETSSSTSMTTSEWHSLVVHFIGGAVGGTAGTAVTCPLEVIKTRIQSSEMQPSTSASSSQPPKRMRVWKVQREILKAEGWRSLWKGLGPNLVGVAPSKAVYFWTYNYLKQYLNSHDEIFIPNSSWVHMFSAAGGGFLAASAINPIWLVKTRLQLHHGPLTIRQCVSRVWKNEGFFGFYKGVSASYIGISETIIQFVLYEYFRDKFIGDNGVGHNGKRPTIDFSKFMLAGATAKLLACLIAYPHEVLRTRLREEGRKHRGLYRTCVALYTEGGVLNFYRGLTVQLMRTVPNTAVTIGTYELVVYLMQRHWIASTTAASESTETTPSS